MAARFPEDERLQDLLTQRAVEGLSDREQQELNEFSARNPDLDPEELERVAASLALAGLRIEPMPGSLRARIEVDAEVWLAGQRREAPANGDRRVGTGSAAGPLAEPRVVQLPAKRAAPTVWGGWVAAAAAMVIAVVGWLQVERMDQERASLAGRQAVLEASVGRLERNLAETTAALAAARDPAPGELLAALEAHPETLVVAWTATDDPTAAGAAGAVVWNGAEQAGLMRFHGLEANDPTAWQYQLWIFDAERDERFPVDGGVFDVSPGEAETLVPIRARLPVGEAVLFAITVEPAGGVVVSSRERIALVAQPGA